MRSVQGVEIICVAKYGLLMVCASTTMDAGMLETWKGRFTSLLTSGALPGPRTPRSSTCPRMMLLLLMDGSVQRTSNGDTHLHTHAKADRTHKKNKT